MVCSIKPHTLVRLEKAIERVKLGTTYNIVNLIDVIVLARIYKRFFFELYASFIHSK
ncbi:hypothetical protein P20495_1665 [Pseudoalteromonas sp. BSi20495]|nr:hypothetical protein P20495_1665 [Pseudoalteromonas sp. BSi20495]